MRQNIYTTTSCSAVVPPKLLNQFYLFLIAHPAALLDKVTRQEIFSPRRQNQDAISTLFHTISQTGFLDHVRLFKTDKHYVDPPEVTQMIFLPFDELQAEGASPSLKATTQAFPDVHDKIHLNITDLTRADGEVVNYPLLYSRIVRDFLVRSYYVSSQNSWISYPLIQYICKVYNMTLGGFIANLYNLDPAQRGEVIAVFCLYYMGMMTRRDQAPQILKTHIRDLGLPPAMDLDQIFSFTQDVLSKDVPETLEDVFTVVGQLNPKLVTLNRTILFSRARSLTQENYVNMISLEYPPLFAYFIIRALNGDRTGLSFVLKNTNLLSPGREFLTRLSSEFQLLDFGG